MEFRQLGKSGLQVPVLCFGTGTFGGGSEFFRAWGETDVEEATRLIDICLEAGVNFFDTADVYSQGLSEEILGEAIRHVPRESVLISTKATFPFGEGPNNVGSSRHHLTRQIEGSLKRLKTDYIDVYHMHGFDALTPIEETLSTLDQAVRARQGALYRGIEFLGLAPAEVSGHQRAIWMGALCCSPGLLFSGWPRLRVGVDAAGVFRRHRRVGVESAGLGTAHGQDSPRPTPAGSEPSSQDCRTGPRVPDEYLYKVVDALDALAAETGKSVPQLALNWLLRKPTISSVIIGARNEQQLRDNLAAASFVLTAEQVARWMKRASRQCRIPTGTSGSSRTAIRCRRHTVRRT